MADMMMLEVPTERLDDVHTLIDYMGWQVGVVDDAQLSAARVVRDACGFEPDYCVHSIDSDDALDSPYIVEFYPTDDARVMIDAIRAYIKATTPIDLHFTVGGGPLSGRKMFFYDSRFDGARKLGYVWHRLDGWWVVVT
jgi:hypothetical protein